MQILIHSNSNAMKGEEGEENMQHDKKMGGECPISLLYCST